MTDRATHPRPLLPRGPRGARGTRRRTSALVAALAVPAAVLLAGCGDDSGDTAADPGSSSPSMTMSMSPGDTMSMSPSTSSSPSSSPPSSPSEPVPTIDPQVASAVAPALKDGYPALISTGLPTGWAVQSAAYDAGRGAWTMTLTDDTGATVELHQANGALPPLLRQYAGGTTASGKVNLNRYGLGTWTTYDAGDQPAIATKLPDTAVVVSGSDQDHLVALAQTLITAEDSDMPDAG